METRASHLLVGSFVLLVSAAIFLFALWLAKIQIDRETAYYDIFFEDSVAGLGVGGDVRYRGTEVGSVAEIGIHPDDPGRVRVTVQIGSETPIREGDKASLQLQGITGVLFVNIEGASAADAKIRPRKRRPWPEIPSEPSPIAQLFEGAPDLITRAAVATERISDVVNDENRQMMAEILRDVKSLTGALAAREEQFGRVLDALDGSSGELLGLASTVGGNGKEDRSPGGGRPACPRLRPDQPRAGRRAHGGRRPPPSGRLQGHLGEPAEGGGPGRKPGGGEPRAVPGVQHRGPGRAGPRDDRSPGSHSTAGPPRRAVGERGGAVPPRRQRV